MAEMKEYIDLDENITVVDTRGRERETTVRRILDINKGAYKTADVRPVVLCRDCVYSDKWYADRLICYLWNEHDGNAVFEDGFCNYGKKREES